MDPRQASDYSQVHYDLERMADLVIPRNVGDQHISEVSASGVPDRATVAALTFVFPWLSQGEDRAHLLVLCLWSNLACRWDLELSGKARLMATEVPGYSSLSSCCH